MVEPSSMQTSLNNCATLSSLIKGPTRRISSGVDFGGLIVFITGADAIPPLGFDYPIVIAFYDMDANSRRLPWSSTCSLTLNLPRSFEDAQQFNALNSNALLNCYGFGKG